MPRMYLRTRFLFVVGIIGLIIGAVAIAEAVGGGTLLGMMPHWTTGSILGLLSFIAFLGVFSSGHIWQSLLRLVCLAVGVVLGVAKITALLPLALALSGMALLLLITAFGFDPPTRARHGSMVNA